MSYVIYARKSTESDDRQVLSIESQVRELRMLAARQGLAIAEVLTESHSAKAPGRPVFGELFRNVQSGKVRGVVCWKMDRLARNHLDTGVVLQALADGRLERVVTSDRTYTRDGNDRFMGNFELGMATKFIDDLRANVRRGNRARFARGWVNHNPALGYLLDPLTKTIIKDPERFDLVRRMWELLLTGAVRVPQIRRMANDTWGFRTRRFKRIGGRPLTPSVLYKIFQDPFYMGVIRLQTGETYVGAHPPMISREEFDRAQELLGRPGRPRPQKHEFPFTGLIRCGRCGATVTAEEHVKKSGRRYVYYHCTRQRAGVTCPYEAVPERDLEDQFARLLGRLSMPERVLAWLRRKAEASVVSEAGRREKVQAMARETLAALDGENEALLSLRLRELIDDATFVARQKQLKERKVSLEQKLGAAEKSVTEVRDLALATFSFASRAREVFLTGTTVQKRMILEAVASNYTLRGRKLLYEAKKPFQMISGAAACCNWQTLWDDVRTWLQDTTEYFALPEFTNTTIAELSSTAQAG